MSFDTARKALEQAVEADGRFALAHAELARAYDEMDYTDEAKRVMLHGLERAREVRLSRADQTRLSALQLTVAREYDRAVPLYRELEESAPERLHAAAALETGWLAQQRDDTEGAKAAYSRAVSRDPRYAAAKLRLGFILGRQLNVAEALQAFGEAEELYRQSSDSEGIIETLFQRANLLHRRGRSDEAMQSIDRALSVALTLGSRYHEIRLLRLQGVALRNRREFDRAAELVNRAIALAESERMDNLAAAGLLDLGSIVQPSDPDAAERHYQQALAVAARGQVRRLGARAHALLASLYEQRHMPADARRHAEPAHAFFLQSGYRAEWIQITAVLAGISAQEGEYAEGVRLSREALATVIPLREPIGEALVRQRLARNLLGSGAWPEALEEYQETAKLQESDALKLARARVCMWLGRRQQALQYLADVANNGTGGDRLAPLLARRAEVAAETGDWPRAKAAAAASLDVATRTGEREAEFDASLLLAVAGARTRTRPALTAEALVGKLDAALRKGDAARTRLAVVEAHVLAGDRQYPSQWLAEAREFFEVRQIRESAWRAHALAFLTADSRQRDNHRAAALAGLAALPQIWPAEDVRTYRARPAVQALSRPLQV
jgi:tetratricopeptide (TPR) repeat protein